MAKKSNLECLLAGHKYSHVSNKIKFLANYFLFDFFSRLTVHSLLFICQVFFNDYNLEEMSVKWPALIVLLVSTLLIFFIAELCKYYEIKNEKRAIRRARLDFGTKLGMNSPF